MEWQAHIKENWSTGICEKETAVIILMWTYLHQPAVLINCWRVDSECPASDRGFLPLTYWAWRKTKYTRHMAYADFNDSVWQKLSTLNFQSHLDTNIRKSTNLKKSHHLLYKNCKGYQSKIVLRSQFENSGWRSGLYDPDFTIPTLTHSNIQVSVVIFSVWMRV